MLMKTLNPSAEGNAELSKNIENNDQDKYIVINHMHSNQYSY